MEKLSQIASSIDEYLPETEHTLFTHRNNPFIESFERKRASNEIIETREHGYNKRLLFINRSKKLNLRQKRGHHFCWRLEKIKKCFILKSNRQIICDQRKKKGKKHKN